MFKSMKKKSLSVLFVYLLCLFSYSFTAYTKTIVISDIDDTLKKANSAGAATEQVYHFLKKIPYLEMRDLFNEIKEQEKSRDETVKFYYVSAAKTFTFNAQKWLQKNHFPLGRSTLKTFSEKRATYAFKHDVIKSILEEEVKSLDRSSGEPLYVLMFGDNAQVDAIVYSDLAREFKQDFKIYIRDVRASATFFAPDLPLERVSGVNYYFSEVELFKHPEFNFLSAALLTRTYEAYKNKELIPEYTLKTLNRRLDVLYGDKERARVDALTFWNQYYSQF